MNYNTALNEAVSKVDYLYCGANGLTHGITGLSGNAITYTQATPHFVESEEKTLGIDYYKLSNYLDTITFKKNNLQ